MANNLWYIHSMEFHSVKNERPHTTTWRKLTNTMLNERTEIQKSSCHVILLTGYLKTSNTKMWWRMFPWGNSGWSGPKEEWGASVAITVFFLFWVLPRLCAFFVKILWVIYLIFVHFTICILPFIKKFTLKWSSFFSNDGKYHYGSPPIKR